jgi:hypothetical protein
MAARVRSTSAREPDAIVGSSRREFDRLLDYEKIHASPLELCFILLNLSRGEGQFVSNRQPSEVGRKSTGSPGLPEVEPAFRHEVA